jgi:hypothetical protein
MKTVIEITVGISMLFGLYMNWTDVPKPHATFRANTAMEELK